jgi:hypothetical protein
VQFVASRTDAWASELVCSGQQAEVGRLIEHFFRGPSTNIVTVANISSALARALKSNGRYANAKDFKLLFSHSSLRDVVQRSDVDRYANLVRSGKVSFRHALNQLLLPQLTTDEDRFILTAT